MSKEFLICLLPPGLGKRIIFYCLFLLISCQPKKLAPKDFSLLWREGRAIGLAVAKRKLASVPADSFAAQVQIRRARPGEQLAIPGYFRVQEEVLIFQPLIPFTRGWRYQIWVKQQLLGEVQVPAATQVPELLAIYPSPDTLPENLLKLYLVFSRPMQEGRSADYVALTNHQGDTLPGSFLNLQSELWNAERTILTLWLDPGRIKRDLQPNKALGPPLTAGQSYKLLISRNWPDQDGTTLRQDFTKNLVASPRDTISPALADWKFQIPLKNTQKPLVVSLPEPLDYQLLQHAVRVIDVAGKPVKGRVQITQEERKYLFRPEKAWLPGLYQLQVEARLEDVAGNNLNRLFDRDLQAPNSKQSVKSVFVKEWQVE